MYIIKSFNKNISNQEEEDALTTLGGLLYPSPDILRAFVLHRLLAGLLLCLLSGLLLLLPGLLLPFSVDILSK
jgi:hypothetical protein